MARMGYAQHREVFNNEMENDLTQSCINLARVHHGLSSEKKKQLAFEFALRNNLKMPQSWLENRKAGRQRFIRPIYFYYQATLSDDAICLLELLRLRLWEGQYHLTLQRLSFF